LPGKFDGAEFVRKTIMEQEKNRNIFETMPVPQAFRIMALPTIMIAVVSKAMLHISCQNIAFYSNTKKNDRNQPPFGVK
jgi:hypothetical protein